MNNYKKIISVAIAGVMLTGFSSCRDDWSAMNNPEDKLTSATPIQLLTTAEYGIYPFGYGIWFNGAPAFMSLTQMSGFSGGYNETRAALQTPGSQSCMIKLLSYNAAMEAELEKLGALHIRIRMQARSKNEMSVQHRTRLFKQFHYFIQL